MTSSPGNTPINADELDSLIPNLSTREELNQWERENIILAERWCFSRRVMARFNPTNETDLRELHRRMFDKTWKWAGTYRKTEKTIGVPVIQINNAMASFLGDAQFWIREKSFEPDEIAVRFHHRLVCIHPFPNGNGRHSRLIADILAVQLGKARLTWGRLGKDPAAMLRRDYISALQQADAGQIKPLLDFARS